MSRDRAAELLKYDRFKGTVSVSLLVGAFVWGIAGVGSAAVKSHDIGPWGIPGLLPEKPKVQTAVKVSHPQLLEPVPGSEISFGRQRFAGVADPGMSIVLFGDGAEMAKGVSGHDGKFSFEAEIGQPVPLVFSMGFYSVGGTKVGGVRDLRYVIDAIEGSVAGSFRVLRPTEKGLVTLGDWIIAGTGKPGSQVKLQLDRWQLGVVDVLGDGTWTLPRKINEVGARRQLTAREIGGYGDEIIVHSVTVVK